LCNGGFDFLFLERFANCAVEIADRFSGCVCWKEDGAALNSARSILRRRRAHELFLLAATEVNQNWMRMPMVGAMLRS
jgi:hypothetical protein